MATEGVTNNGTAGSNTANNDSLTEFRQQAQSKLSNLGTSNKDILDYITEVAQSDDFSQGKSQIINELMNQRSMMATLLTNTMKTLFDAANAVIHNIRTS